MKDIKNHFKEYPVASTQQFLTLPEYLELAEDFARKLAPALFPQIKRSESALSFIAEHLMMADWDYDPDKGASRKTWRQSRAQQAILELLKTSNRKKNSHKNERLDFDVASPKKLPRNVLEDNENKKQIHFLLNNSGLTPTQREYVEDAYLKEMSNGEIAEKNGVTRQAVEDMLNKGLKKMKRCVKNGV
jgi:RNA polymerase sigma factor (sigma-70 family)